MSNKKTNIARNDTGISCETNLASTMEIIADKARYDAAVKELLSDKQVLSRILMFSLAEFENMDIEDIMECLDSPIISGVRVEPGHTNNKIMKSLDEDNVLGEGKIFYDIRFNAYLKLCKDNENITKIIKFIMNVEAQKSTKKTKGSYITSYSSSGSYYYLAYSKIENSDYKYSHYSTVQYYPSNGTIKFSFDYYVMTSGGTSSTLLRSVTANFVYDINKLEIVNSSITGSYNNASKSMLCSISDELILDKFILSEGFDFEITRNPIIGTVDSNDMKFINAAVSLEMTNIEKMLLSYDVSLELIGFSNLYGYKDKVREEYNNNKDKHQLVHVDAKTSTCIEKGNIEYWYCDKCNKYFLDADEKNEIEQDDIYLDYAEHEWNMEYTIDKEPTASIDGVKSIHCKVCNGIKDGSEVVIKYVVPDEFILVKGEKKDFSSISGGGYKYISSDKKIASVNKKGIITAKKSGVVVIMALAENGSEKYRQIYTVEEPKFAEKKIYLFPSETYDISLINTTIGDYATYSASKVGVLEINNGSIKALRKGTISLVANIHGRNIKTKVVIQEPKINYTSLTLKNGAKKTLKIVGSTRKAIWNSSDSSVVSVDNKGRIVANKKGGATITAEVGNRTFKCDVVVVRDVKTKWTADEINQLAKYVDTACDRAKKASDAADKGLNSFSLRYMNEAKDNMTKAYDLAAKRADFSYTSGQTLLDTIEVALSECNKIDKLSSSSTSYDYKMCASGIYSKALLVNIFVLKIIDAINND